MYTLERTKPEKEMTTELRYTVVVVSDWVMQKRPYTITNEQ